MAHEIRLLLVDTPTLARRCLAALLNRRRGLRVIGEAASGPDALAAAQALAPDMVVVEPAVPNGGAQLVAALCRQVPGRAVLVLAQPGDDVAASRALQAGARGYLIKDCEPDHLVRTIERVNAGELVVAPEAARVMLREFAGEEARGAESGDALTAREREVLGLVAYGRTNPGIAQELSITEHTVKGHVAKILRKLRVDNRVQLAAYATQRRLGESVGLPGATPIADGHYLTRRGRVA
jgi:DNA-binding NarL/FixJ family response regulator